MFVFHFPHHLRLPGGAFTAKGVIVRLTTLRSPPHVLAAVATVGDIEIKVDSLDPNDLFTTRSEHPSMVHLHHKLWGQADGVHSQVITAFFGLQPTPAPTLEEVERAAIAEAQRQARAAIAEAQRQAREADIKAIRQAAEAERQELFRLRMNRAMGNVWLRPILALKPSDDPRAAFNQAREEAPFKGAIPTWGRRMRKAACAELAEQIRCFIASGIWSGDTIIQPRSVSWWALRILRAAGFNPNIPGSK